MIIKIEREILEVANGGKKTQRNKHGCSTFFLLETMQVRRQRNSISKCTERSLGEARITLIIKPKVEIRRILQSILLELINEFTNVMGYKINLKNQLYFY